VPTDDQTDTSVPWWRSRFVFIAVACVGLIYVFVHLASEVVERETGTFDHSVRDWVFAHRPPLLVKIFELVTLLGDPVTLAIGAAIVAVIVARGGARLRPLLVAALPFFLSASSRALRGWYQIPRPQASLASALSFGFPSGHTFGSTAVSVVIGYVLARERGARRLGWAIALTVPIAVGISRLYLDMHWASDVIGGWLVGGAYAAAVCAIYEEAFRRAHRRSRG
jgi:undecaprenyl-diphosphatase